MKEPYLDTHVDKRGEHAWREADDHMMKQVREETDRLNEFIRPGIEAQFKRECCVDRPYKIPRRRPMVR